ncbi:hypothetical protein DFH09DRAFT_1077012 [Mycena vulgaris]|nr:hypothetical protein DFH09DRAFT_1077012 [Mycena vulgaris]
MSSRPSTRSQTKDRQPSEAANKSNPKSKSKSRAKSKKDGTYVWTLVYDMCQSVPLAVRQIKVDENTTVGDYTSDFTDTWNCTSATFYRLEETIAVEMCTMDKYPLPFQDWFGLGRISKPLPNHISMLSLADSMPPDRLNLVLTIELLEIDIDLKTVRARKLAPSTAAQHNAMKKTQTTANPLAVFNGHPHPLVGPPITIYHPIFADFQRLLNTPLDEFPFQPGDLKMAAHLCEMVSTYDSEATRAPDIDATLTAFFGGEQDYHTAIINKLAEGVASVSPLPSFLLTTVGSNIAVTGLINLKGMVVSQHLTDYIPLGGTVPTSLPLNSPFVDPQDNHHAIIARLLRSLSTCAESLAQYYVNLSIEPRHKLSPPPHFEQFTSSKKSYEISYIERLVDDRNNQHRTVYVAEVKNGAESQLCVVKFTASYNVELHQLVAKEKAAPGLLYCSQESSVGNLWVVVMQYIPQTRKAPASNAFEKLRTTVNKMHAKQFVFGDLRQPNVLIDQDGSLLLIDFDWSGRVGTKHYPMRINKSLDWPIGVEGGGEITREHDLSNLEKLENAFNNKRGIEEVEDASARPSGGKKMSSADGSSSQSQSQSRSRSRRSQKA